MHELQTTEHHSHVLYYDAVKKRLWIGGQRCHHGATGALVAGAAACGLVLSRMRLRPPGMVGLIAAGSVLMAHDWHDRHIWFERGWQNQP